MNIFCRILPGLVYALSLAACADAEPPGTVDAVAPPPDFDAEVDRLTNSSSPKAIYLVGNQFALGDGVPQDQKMAERLWSRACTMEHTRACAIYGSRMIGAGDYDAAAPALETAAQAGDIDAIRNLVQLHSNANWHGASFEKRLKWMAVLQELGGASMDVPADSPTE